MEAMVHGADVSSERLSFGGKFAIECDGHCDLVTPRALTIERTVIQRLVLRGRLCRNSKDRESRRVKVWTSELPVRVAAEARKSKAELLSPLGCYLLRRG